MTDGSPAGSAKEGLGRVVAWAKQRPALAAAIVVGVVLLAIWASRRWQAGAGQEAAPEEAAVPSFSEMMGGEEDVTDSATQPSGVTTEETWGWPAGVGEFTQGFGEVYTPSATATNWLLPTESQRLVWQKRSIAESRGIKVGAAAPVVAPTPLQSFVSTRLGVIESRGVTVGARTTPLPTMAPTPAQTYVQTRRSILESRGTR